MIPNEFIRGLIDRTDIVELIGREFELKKAGANHNACCPFHHEKTPSFTVSQSKQIFHCFGCGEHGTIISYLMKRRNLEFIEAVQALAEYNGVEVPNNVGLSSQKHEEFASLYAILDKTAGFYEDLLAKSEFAKKYLHSRNISPETIKKYRLGLAPDGYDGITKYFRSSGHVEKSNENLENMLVRSGLLVVRGENKNSGHYDRFRNRLIVPIVDKRNRVIGFGGRSFADELPKYLNSPETEVFHKGRELFGFYQASSAIREANSVIVVEGYFDVISLSQAGIENVVASMGTAITPEQVSMLWQQAQKIILSFDGDSAGEKATFRAIERMLPVIRDGKVVEVVRLPKDTDPDTLVCEGGAEHGRQVLNNGQKLSDFLFAVLKNDYDDSSEGKAMLVKRAAVWISAISSVQAPIFKNDLVAKIADLIKLPIATVLSGVPVNQRGFVNSKKWIKKNISPARERVMLREALNHPEHINAILAGIVNVESKYSKCLFAIADAYENDELPDKFAGRVSYLQEKGYSELMSEQMSEIMAVGNDDTGKARTEDLDFRSQNTAVQVSNRETMERYQQLCLKNKESGLTDEERVELIKLLPLLKPTQITDLLIAKS